MLLFPPTPHQFLLPLSQSLVSKALILAYIGKKKKEKKKKENSRERKLAFREMRTFVTVNLHKSLLDQSCHETQNPQTN